MKNILDDLTGYRVKVERDGKEIVNVPGLLALPGLLIAPKLSIIGMVAAPLLGCSIHLETEDGKKVDVGKAVKDAAETVAEAATTAARTVRDEVEKAWESVSEDDPEECTDEAGHEEAAEEPAEEPADEGGAGDGIPVIHVKPDDSADE